MCSTNLFKAIFPLIIILNNVNQCKCVFFSGHCCAQYDAGIGRVIEDYDRLCNTCPFQYKSDTFLESKMLRLFHSLKNILHISYIISFLI